jgi:hypothetical protein
MMSVVPTPLAALAPQRFGPAVALGGATMRRKWVATGRDLVAVRRFRSRGAVAISSLAISSLHVAPANVPNHASTPFHPRVIEDCF